MVGRYQHSSANSLLDSTAESERNGVRFGVPKHSQSSDMVQSRGSDRSAGLDRVGIGHGSEVSHIPLGRENGRANSDG